MSEEKKNVDNITAIALVLSIISIFLSWLLFPQYIALLFGIAGWYNTQKYNHKGLWMAITSVIISSLMILIYIPGVVPM